MSLNEEEVKIKFVIPLLNRLGFKTVEDLQFEYALGPTLAGTKHRTYADIIVKRLGKAVLLVETKSWRTNIRSRKCINQAVAYARSYETVIPYVLITNGREAILVDALSKEIVNNLPEQRTPEKDFAQQVESTLKEETLRLLNVMRLEDLRQLADAQRKREISILRGEQEQEGRIVDRKYIPSLYVPRTSLERAFQDFLTSAQKVFALVGDAGMGKTNFLCDTAEVLGQASPVLFYNAVDLNGSLKEVIMSDLRKILPGCTFEDVLEKTSSALDGHSTNTFVFLDGLNECSSGRDSLRAELNELTREIIHCPWRLVVSCRSLDWDYWCRNENNMVGHFGRAVYTGPAVDSRVRRGVVVAELDETEFELAWGKYKEGFSLRGTLSQRMERICREPFMLRLVAEVYRGGKEIPEFIEPLELFHRYFEEKFPSHLTQIDSKRFLFWMASRMLNDGLPRVRVSDLNPSDMSVCRHMLDENVIISRKGDYLHFHFELFLEFVVSQFILSQQLDEMTSDEKLSHLLQLTESRLINMAGVVENILLSWQNDPALLVLSLRRLTKLGERWKAIACSTVRKLAYPPEDLAEVIYELAGDSNYVIRLFLSQSLGNFLKVAGGQYVLQMARDPDRWEVRETAANIIGNEAILDTSRSEALSGLMDDFHWRVRRAAGYALQKLWSSDSPLSKRHKVSILRDISNGPWRRKYSLCIALLQTDLDASTEDSRVIMSFANDSNHQVRWTIANYLPRYHGHARHNLIAVLSRDDDPWVRRKLVDSIVVLIERGDEEAKLHLRLMAKDPEPSVRLTIARRLETIGNRRWVTTILTPYLQDTYDVAFAAAYTLQTIGAIDDVRVRRFLDLGDRAKIRRYRERIARKDVDPATARFSPIQDYISRRTEFADRNDPYMKVIDTMCSLIASTSDTIQSSEISIGEFLDFTALDSDEAVCWALVLFLVKYGAEQLDWRFQLSMLGKLAQHSHWWVRREVAAALGEFSKPQKAKRQAVKKLLGIQSSEKEGIEACKDEVLYFVGQSLRKLKGGGQVGAQAEIKFARK